MNYKYVEDSTFCDFIYKSLVPKKLELKNGGPSRSAKFCLEFIRNYFERNVKKKESSCRALLYIDNLINYFAAVCCNYPFDDHCWAILYLILHHASPIEKIRKALKSLFSEAQMVHVECFPAFGEQLYNLLPTELLNAVREMTQRNREKILVDKVLEGTRDILFSPYEKEINDVFKSNMQKQEKICDDDSNPFEAFRKYSLGFLNPNTYEQFFNELFLLLSSPKSDEEVQKELLAMTGQDHFVNCIINNRQHFAEPDVLEKLLKVAIRDKNLKSDVRIDRNNSGPLIARQVVVMSANEKNLIKKLNKLEKKAYKSSGESAYVTEHVLRQLEAEQYQPLFKRASSQVLDISNIHNENQDRKIKAMVCGKSVHIPADAKRKMTEKYEEIVLPPKEQLVTDGTHLIRVDKLDVIGKVIFSEIKQFNRIQSEVFPVAYNTNENMLICAPTGAGKTNIALMTMIHQIKQYITDQVLNLNKFKIVYVCPMKALASEMTANFHKNLSSLGMTVKEITGDMQLSRKEIMETQLLVTTPEKWDVITRKGQTDTELISLLKLLILDEVHLLNSDRGPVVEALVARTLRQVVSSQNMIRIVGLSATLPNYMDVARFLKVNTEIGLFYFDDRYRSVPLSQTIIGFKSTKSMQASIDLDEICFEKVVAFLRDGHQVMVFVHARNQTLKTANNMKEMARKQRVESLFQPDEKSMASKKIIWKTKTNELNELFSFGLGIHHAGMIRSDRNEVERAFTLGTIRVLICTATLAWGVNLPAHAVIIKGTTLYDIKKCSYVDLDILDVLQIFGRAGRPQFDSSGSGVIITSQEKMNYYLSSLTNQIPIESQFIKSITDNLNAEVVLGTVTNVQEAVEWMTFTYLYQRMRVNPLVYGLTYAHLQKDPDLREALLNQVHNAAVLLDKAKMMRYAKETGELTATNLGRTASYFYINFDTVETFNELIVPNMTESEIINMMCHATEFKQIQVRQEELNDLEDLQRNYCEFSVPGGVENVHGKVNILMQTYLSRGFIKTLSLASDMEYITQSTVRLARALFDIVTHVGENNAVLSGRCLLVAKMFEQRLWPFQHPMNQFPDLPPGVLMHLSHANLSIQDLRDMSDKEIGNLVRNHKFGSKTKQYAEAFPILDISSKLQPITRNVVRVRLYIKPVFKWLNSVHATGFDVFWLWVEDTDTNNIYHSESFTVTKNICVRDETVELVFTIPLMDPRPASYLVRIESNKWLHAAFVHTLTFDDLKLPDTFTPHTDLLELQPLEVTVLQNPEYESLYNFTHFNPIQSQIFHCLYHTDHNLLLGAPTGSGKTIVAEICMFRLFNIYPELKVVYIAPLKALVRERSKDWKKRFGEQLGKNVVEITGDVSPSAKAIKNANLIVTTPEKWDGMSRGWQTRNYIRDVGLMIIDEIHLLGEDRGPVIEVIVTRTNFISERTGRSLRIVGLSTALANAGDLANWLGIDEMGLYNFRPSVRPVPINVHIAGFPGKHYCPRMLSMNRPTYQAIQQHAPDSPTLIFCSSRKQTRFTACGLITYLLTDSNPKQWLKCDQDSIESLLGHVKDNDLKHFLNFGIGIHHAGLQERDRKIVEELFVHQKIRVLIATATLAWGVNFPAHLVIIKGTEYFDGHIKRYVDMPITDVLQMMGRAGRPQYDTFGVACVFVHDIKKNFYKRFLYEPFPVESNLLAVLPDHFNAEIAAGTVPTKRHLTEYLTMTYFFRRLLENPSYYSLEDVSPETVDAYLGELVDKVAATLEENKCITVSVEQDVVSYEPTFLGHVASFYYLSHKTVNHLFLNLKQDSNIYDLLHAMCYCEEYAIFPVRHNEDKINAELAKELSYNTNNPMDSPHVKAILLILGYLYDIEFPNPEYIVDLKTVLDSAFRILQGMIDITANNGWLACTMRIVYIMQMMIQGVWIQESELLTIPHIDKLSADVFRANLTAKLDSEDEVLVNLPSLKILYLKDNSFFDGVLEELYKPEEAQCIVDYIRNIPLVTVNLIIKAVDTGREHEIFLGEEIPAMNFEPDKELEFTVTFMRDGRDDLSVHSRRFPKQKDEAWILCFGLPENDQALVLRRISMRRSMSVKFTITTPKQRGIITYALYLISDCYLGIDQQYWFSVNVL